MEKRTWIFFSLLFMTILGNVWYFAYKPTQLSGILSSWTTKSNLTLGISSSRPLSASLTTLNSSLPHSTVSSPPSSLPASSQSTIHIKSSTVQNTTQSSSHTSRPTTTTTSTTTAAPDNGKYVIKTSTCSIPDLDPWDPKYKHHFAVRQKVCGKNFPETVIKLSQTLVVNKKHASSITHCVSRDVTRPEESDDETFVISDKSYTFNVSFTPSADVVKVECYKGSSMVYMNYFSFFHREPSPSPPPIDATYGRRAPSVLLIGIDSVSRQNSMRHMPKMRKYLSETLGAVEFPGYNKVGDSTFPNLVAMFAGKTFEELPWDPQDKSRFDKYWWIWNDYQKAGYQTMFGEDYPSGAIYNWAKAGFNKAPTRYYSRPMFLAMDKEKKGFYNEDNCFREKLQSEILMEYSKDFSDVYQNDPFYAFTFATRLTHDYMGQTAMADPVYLKFFTDMKAGGLFDNLVVFVFSDHGLRFGGYRETAAGRLEERLPFLFVILPPHLKKTYPQLQTALQKNAQRLTTPFDVHETLKDLLLLPQRVGNHSVTPRGVSLFAEIPENRTCKQAGIELHYCTCQQRISVKSTEVAERAVKGAVASLNSKLGKFQHLCYKLYLERLDEAVELKERSKGASKTSGIQLSFSTLPGRGLFEVTVTEAGDITGSISRINKYGDTSWCVNDMDAKKICYCKKQRSKGI